MIPRITPRKLKAGWGSSDESLNDLHYSYGEGCRRADMRLLNEHLPPLVEELARRGYDLTTLRFECAMKAE